MRDERQAQKLGKVFAVEREGAPVERANAVSLCAQRTGKRSSSRWPIFRFFSERGHNNLSCALWYFLASLAQWWRWQVDMLVHDTSCFARERRLACKHLIGYNAQTINVGARV